MSFRVRSLVSALAILGLAACDNGPPPPGSRDSGPGGRRDGSTPGDAGPLADGEVPFVDAGPGIVGAPDIRCVSPDPGSMVVAEVGETLVTNVLVTGGAQLDLVTVNGEAVTPDFLGLVRIERPARFGVNHFEVVATTMAGAESREVCSVLAAPSYQDQGSSLRGATEMFLTATAIDDANPDDGLDSVNDVFTTALAGGLLAELLSTHLSDGAVDIKALSCDLPAGGATGATCDVETEIEYVSNTVSGPFTSSLVPIADGLRFRGRGENVQLTVTLAGSERVSGSTNAISSAGTIDLTFVEFDVDIRVFENGDGDVDAEVTALNEVLTGEVTADFPDLGSPVRGLAQSGVASHISGSTGDGLRDSLGTSLGTGVADLLATLLGTVRVRTLAANFNPPTLAGSTTRMTFSSRYDDIQPSAAGLNFVLRATYGGVTTGPFTLGVAMPPPASDVLPDPAGAVRNIVSASAFNLVFHRHWRAGGMNATIAPDAIVAPEMIVGPELIVTPDTLVLPDTVEIDSSLPAVVDSTTADGVQVMFGDVEMTIPPQASGPFVAGVHARFAATVNAISTATGAHPQFGTLAISELSIGTDEALPSGAWDELEQLVTLVAWHMASFALNDAGPALPLASLRTTEEFVPYGLTDGTVLGTLDAGLNPVNTELLMDGAFGMIP